MAGCSSYHHHHGTMGSGKSEAYWQKGQQDMEGLINRTIKDLDKAKQVNVLVGEIIKVLKASREQERAYHRDLYTLNASYTAAPDRIFKNSQRGEHPADAEFGQGAEPPVQDEGPDDRR